MEFPIPRQANLRDGSRRQGILSACRQCRHHSCRRGDPLASESRSCPLLRPPKWPFLRHSGPKGPSQAFSSRKGRLQASQAVLTALFQDILETCLSCCKMLIGDGLFQPNGYLCSGLTTTSPSLRAFIASAAAWLAAAVV